MNVEEVQLLEWKQGGALHPAHEEGSTCTLHSKNKKC